MRALIIEDEYYNFVALKRIIIQAYPRAEVEGPVTNLIDLERAMLDQELYDVIYCDIQLEDGECFSVLEHIDVTTPIVFTTAYNEYALKAFNANGIAYLLKPINKESLCKATDKALSLKQTSQNLSGVLGFLKTDDHTSYLHYLKANAYDGSYIINVDDVACFNAKDKGSYAMMTDGTKHTIFHSLDKLILRLDPTMFFRANRQFIVNRNGINRIQTFANRKLLIKIKGYDEVQVIVSKENAPYLNNWIEQ